LISDTHGMLRVEALDALRGSDFIIHAGDIGQFDIIERLERIAPVTAVRGNNDIDAWASELREIEVLEVGSVRIGVIHDLAQLAGDPVAAGYRAVVAGHSHNPKIIERNDVLYVNPGSAGPRRFKLPVSVGRIDVSGTSIRAQLITLAA
jgi:putative phosphoesterase